MSTSLKNNSSIKGFTLVELMVSVSVFTFIMLISTGSILSVFDANKKSQNLRTVMDNLSFTLEGMTRTIRFGTNYHCNIYSGGDLTVPLDCAGGSNSIQVRSSDGKQIQYWFDTSAGRIMRTTNGTPYALTGTDVTIQTLTFRVVGSPKYPDTYQPRVVITLSGYAGVKPSVKSTFNLETSVSQRLFDSQ